MLIYLSSGMSKSALIFSYWPAGTYAGSFLRNRAGPDFGELEEIIPDAFKLINK